MKGGREKLTITSGVFLAGDHGLGVEEGPVGADLHVVDNARLEICVDRTGDVFSGAGLGKESRETVLSSFGGAFLNTAVGLCVNSTLATIMKEHTKHARSTHARGYTIPLRCRNIYMFKRVNVTKRAGNSQQALPIWTPA